MNEPSPKTRRFKKRPSDISSPPTVGSPDIARTVTPRDSLQRSGSQSYLQRDLLARGWSKAAITRILGEPDRRKRRYGGGEYCFYDAERVEQAELTCSDWRKSEKRSVATIKAAATRASELLAKVDALPIVIHSFDEGDEDNNATLLLRAAIAHYNARQTDTERRFASENESTEFLHRIAVNYLRHECTPYDDQLEAQYGKVGTEEARLALLRRIYEAIEERYPHLAQECWNQLEKREAGALYRW